MMLKLCYSFKVISLIYFCLFTDIDVHLKNADFCVILCWKNCSFKNTNLCNVDFGMGSAAGKPPPYEQTHNFTDYPSSHVDIDEVNF